MWGTSPTDVLAAGDTGTVIHYDGQKWIVVPTGSKATLKGIFGFGPDDVYFVGGKGTILHWTGTEFVDESVQTNQEFLTAFGDAEQNLVMASGNHQMVLTPFVTPVRNVYPEKGGIITENYLEWTVKPGPASSFYYLDLSQPSMFGPVLFWDLMTDGDVLQTDLPDFPNIQGTPGVPAGYYIFSNTRVYKEGFDIDHYDFMDLDYRTWRSFSFASTDFTAE